VVPPVLRRNFCVLFCSNRDRLQPTTVIQPSRTMLSARKYAPHRYGSFVARRSKGRLLSDARHCSSRQRTRPASRHRCPILAACRYCTDVECAGLRFRRALVRCDLFYVWRDSPDRVAPSQVGLFSCSVCVSTVVFGRLPETHPRRIRCLGCNCHGDSQPGYSTDLARAASSHEGCPVRHYGAGLWTGHPIGLVVVVGLLFMGFVGLPEARWFLAFAVPAGAVCGLFMWLRHRKGLTGR
jgi:hypothetical protein